MKAGGKINPEDLDAFLDNVLDPAPKKTFPFSMYYSEGVKYHQSRQYDMALKNYEMALQINPASVKALLKRSRAYIELQEYSKARGDVMAALNLTSFFSEACDLKGRCEYFIGDFERAFLTFIRGKQLCPGSEKLKLGGQLCEEAMRNAMLEQSEKNIDGQDLKTLLKRNVGDRPSTRNSRYSNDKKVFEKLLEDGDMKYVHGICRDGLEFIDKSEKFWRMQKPQRNRRRSSPVRPIYKKEESVQYTVSVIRRCKNYLQNEMASHCVSEGQKLLMFFESYPESLSNGNIKFKADALHLLGLAYEMEMKDRLSMNYFEKELKVSKTHNLLHSQMRAFHHLGRRYLRTGKMKKACRCLSGIREVLNSKRIKNYFKISQSNGLDNESSKGDHNTELAEIHAASVWAQNFKSELRSIIQEAVIAPAEYLLLDLYEKEMKDNEY